MVTRNPGEDMVRLLGVEGVWVLGFVGFIVFRGCRSNELTGVTP